jgi:peptidoglycan/xylan/chitin deacetylase (PgdA/CDA1 family)
MNAKIMNFLSNVFICLIVILPLILGGIQLKSFIHIDSRKVADTPAMQVRAIDKNTSPIKPFNQPLVTVTFDDGWESVYTTALPLLQKYGIPTTQYIISGVSADQHYMSIAQIKDMQRAGHDIGCHTVDHADLTKINADQLKHELEDCKTTLEGKLGTNVVDFASPYGSNNDQTFAAIKKVYRSQRNTNGDITTNGVSDQDVNLLENFNPLNIEAITLRRETTDAELQQAIDYAVSHNAWLVLNYHDVEDGASKFGLNQQTLESQLAAVSHAKARVVTLAQVMNAITASATAGKR